LNSVCGCAARNARGAKMSLDGAKKPDHLITVFAGVDRRSLMQQDNKCFLFLHHRHLWRCSKNGELVHMLERHHIEGRPAEMIAENLMLTTNTANPVKIIFQTTLTGVVFLFEHSQPQLSF
jgi:putative YphP/YqiW family bacilliredoxin